MKYLIIALTIIALTWTTLSGQTATEAIRYSKFDVLGTARSMGTAGSMSSLGGDFALLSLNPAGVGVYRGSEFTLSPGYFNNSTDAYLDGTTDPSLRRTTGRLLLSNIGLVLATQPRDTKWKTSNFAFGVTKLADYHEKFEYTGSTTGTITDRYRQLASGLTPDQLSGEASLAYSSGAIYDFDEDLEYESDYLLNDDASILKRQSFESSGYNTELLFAYGANYDEKFIFGISVGVPILSYEEHKIYREDDRDEAVDFFNALRYEDVISTSGSGFNMKAGVIFKPSKWINVGLAYHTRTRYALTDNFVSEFEYDYTDSENDGPILTKSPDGTFRYNLRTPGTVSGGIGAVIAQSGFLSAEVSYQNYGGARFKYTGRGNGDRFSDQEDAVNESIEAQFDDALTLRFGAEVAIRKFRVRGGVELDQRPYVNDDAFDPTFNGGIGFRGDRFFVDLAYQRASREEGFLPYAVTEGVQPLVQKEETNNRVVMTLAYRWQ